MNPQMPGAPGPQYQQYPQQYPQQQQQYPQAPTPYMGPPPQEIVARNKQRPPMGLIITIIVLMVFLCGAGGFGFWAYASRQDYKQNTDQKVSAAVSVAKQQEDSRKDAEFLEKEKDPLRQYKTPASYGSLVVMYPKTWSAFVTEQTNNGSSTPIDGYFHPSFVPGLQSGTDFALRVQVVQSPYANEVKNYDSLVKQGKVTATPYKAPKMAGVTGMRFDGEINQGQTGSMIVLPLRDKTIKISTQSKQFMTDLNDRVLANLVFEP